MFCRARSQRSFGPKGQPTPTAPGAASAVVASCRRDEGAVLKSFCCKILVPTEGTHIRRISNATHLALQAGRTVEKKDSLLYRFQFKSWHALRFLFYFTNAYTFSPPPFFLTSLMAGVRTPACPRSPFFLALFFVMSFVYVAYVEQPSSSWMRVCLLQLALGLDLAASRSSIVLYACCTPTVRRLSLYWHCCCLLLLYLFVRAVRVLFYCIYFYCSCCCSRHTTSSSV